MATATIEVAAVHKSIAKVLESLSVEKGGQLPANMGGKSYITAVDASAEVKRKFVANGLVFYPTERVVNVERILNNNRLQVGVVIEGTYRIVSTEDQSEVTVGGVGDGLATGTAVASNIASTNALKNALLRTFLITEQSVEDEAKRGQDDAPASGAPKSSPTQRKLDAARSSAPKTAAPAAKDIIRVQYIESGKVSKDVVNTAIQEAKAAGANQAQAFDVVLEKLKSGEIQ